jgi:hypothetical protein
MHQALGRQHQLFDRLDRPWPGRQSGFAGRGTGRGEAHGGAEGYHSEQHRQRQRGTGWTVRSTGHHADQYATHRPATVNRSSRENCPAAASYSRRNRTGLRSPPKAPARRTVGGCLPTTTLGTQCSGRSEGMVGAGDGVRLGPVRPSCPGGGRAGCAELAGPHALGQPASPSRSEQSGHGRAVAGSMPPCHAMPRRVANQVRLRLPQQAARTAGPPRTRPGRWINRAKRTLRLGRSTPLRGATVGAGAFTRERLVVPSRVSGGRGVRTFLQRAAERPRPPATPTGVRRSTPGGR